MTDASLHPDHSTHTTPSDAGFAPPQLGYGALFLKFLGFGLLAFGGPVAQIAMIRQALIERERWIDPARFNRLLAVLQALPGPEAHELCVHLGIVARGRIGGILAGLGFMLPGLLLMILAGWVYQRWVAGSGGFDALLLGVQIVVLAVIGRAIVRIGQHIVTGWATALIAIAAAAATFAGVPFWVPLLAGGLALGLAQRSPILAGVGALVLVALAAVGPFALGEDSASGGGLAGVTAPLVAGASMLALFITGLKGGLLTFGGAYTAIPYVRADAVGHGWVSDGTFLDGVAIAGLLPAPLVIFATFTGYVAGGLSGALAITAGMFLPAFAFSLLFYERLEAVVENPALHHFLDGVAAAVVGIIGATLWQLAGSTAGRVAPDLLHWGLAAAMFAGALLAAFRLKGPWVVPAIVAGGAAAGALLLG